MQTFINTTCISKYQRAAHQEWFAAPTWVEFKSKSYSGLDPEFLTVQL